MKMMPNLQEDVPQLKTVEDSILLGQLMIYADILIKAMKHPNIIAAPGSYDAKYPKYLADDLPLFSYDGLYIEKKIENKE